jgi:hypothetical protein
MDTMTYASVAALPASIVQSSKYPVVPESEFVPLDLSYINRKTDLQGSGGSR